jgi:hypothetical protein
MKQTRTFKAWQRYSKEIEPDNYALKYMLSDWEIERNRILEILGDLPPSRGEQHPRKNRVEPVA